MCFKLIGKSGQINSFSDGFVTFPLSTFYQAVTGL